MTGNPLEKGAGMKDVSQKNASFSVRLIEGGRITIPSSIRELLGLREGDKIVCSIRADENEEMLPLKTLWRILQACRKGLASKEIAKRCRLSSRTSKSCVSLLVEEKLLSVNSGRDTDGAEDTYRTTQKGLEIMRLVVQIRGRVQ